MVIIKVLMILSNPFMVDPRVYKEAKALVEKGHQVKIIVWDRKKEYTEKETVDGIEIYRVHNKGLMKILPNDLLRNPIWWRRAYRKALGMYEEGFDFDVVHCHDLDTLQSGIWIKKKLGVKVVFDSHEIFGYMIEKDVPGFVKRYTFRMEKKLMKNVDHVITVNDLFKKYFEDSYGKPVTVVMNCKNLITKDYVPSESKKFTLIYIGIMAKDRFFPEILDVVESLDVKLILAGKKEGLYFKIKEKSKFYKNVEFLGTIKTEEIIDRTLQSDAVFVLVDPENNNNRRTVYNKQFESMVCGRPIIITKNTYAGDMTERLECGLTVDYTEESIKEAIKKLKNDSDFKEKLGRNALNAAKERYNWEKEKERLIKVYEEKL